jgi:hypothetical protein
MLTILDFLETLKEIVVQGEDSSYSEVYRKLNSEQIQYIVNEWNNAGYVGSCIFKPKYLSKYFLKTGQKEL